MAYYFSGNDETSFGDAKANALRTIQAVRRIAGAGGRAVIHLTAPGSHKGHRYAIATVKPYQGQREGKSKPKNWQAMREWLEADSVLGFKVKLWDDREADDGVAAAARYAFESGRRPAIFSRDKDFQMIPGRHVSWTTLGVTEVEPTTWAIADEDGRLYGQKWFWLQMLTGDAADNVPGLPGQPAKGGGFKACGAACAESYLGDANTPEEAYARVRDLYERYYGASWPAAFTEQAALLWMRTDNKASVGDFLRAVPFKVPALDRAVFQLERRIKQ
jgi:DNA polymerase-1